MNEIEELKNRVNELEGQVEVLTDAFKRQEILDAKIMEKILSIFGILEMISKH